MAQEWIRWLNGIVYSLFGPDGLVWFSAHPMVYGLTIFFLLGGIAAWLVLRGLRLGRNKVNGLRRGAALLLTTPGRRCLRLARTIRTRVGRIRGSLRREIEDRSERRSLQEILDRFIRIELDAALDQAHLLIAGSNDRSEQRLRRELERQTAQWSAMEEGSERERFQVAIAETRQRLLRISEKNGARDRLLLGLEEAATAVESLEDEMAGLRLARHRTLPDFRDRLNAVSERMSHLKAAHLELQGPP